MVMPLSQKVLLQDGLSYMVKKVCQELKVDQNQIPMVELLH